MKLKMLTLSLLISMSTLVEANFLKTGSYLGSHNGKDCVDLMLKPAPGRDGSFLAVLMKDEKKVSLYVVDLINSTSYAMTPLEVTARGEIGIINDDPSLVITSGKDDEGKQVFKIMSANSSNQKGFTGFFEFKGKSSKATWLEIQDGQYKLNDNKSALQISAVDQNEREATAVFLTQSLSGTFSFREKFPSMYLINQNAYLATGEKKNEIPSAIGIFTERKGGFGSKRTELNMVNPQNDQDITIYELIK